MKKIVLTVLGIWLAGTQAATAQKSIAGTVVNNVTGQPLPGVNIMVKDTTTIGTTTDANGNYTLQVPANKNVLVFSFIGFIKKEIPIGDQERIDIRLKEAKQQLEELVVVGYGTQAKKDMTGSVSSVSGAELENTTENNVQQTLQGRSAGDSATSAGGQVGEGVRVNIRGSSSLSAGNQPLYVVDGVPVTSQSISARGPQNNPLASLDMSNIASISILKDASAAAIYGSRASNGVVIINTKDSQPGRTKVSASYQASTSSATHKLDFMNARQYVQFFRQAAKAGGKYDYRMNPTQWSSQQEAVNAYLDDYTSKLNDISSGNDWQNDPASYNWQDQAFQGGGSKRFRINASGGDEQTTFLAGGAYRDKQGILLDKELEKISGRLNLIHHATDKLELGLRVTLNRAINDRLSATSSWSGPLSVFQQAPIPPIFAEAAPNQPGYQKGEKYNTQTLFPNAVDLNKNTERRERTFHTLGNVNGEYELLPNLSFKSRFGMDLIHQNYKRYSEPHLSYHTGAEGTGFNAWTEVQNYTNDNIF